MSLTNRRRFEQAYIPDHTAQIFKEKIKKAWSTSDQCGLSDNTTYDEESAPR